MKSGKPASSASPSSRSVKACSSARTFWLNAVPSVAETFDDFGETILGRVVERRARAAEAGMVALEHALLLGHQPERIDLAHQRVDAPEQRAHWC